MTIRMGILGAARIAPAALIKPARTNSEVEVAAVAARDPAKAETFATKHGIPRVHSSYDELLADPDIDAIYNPLPNGYHGRWTIAAVEAGKHVLCEKPFTANADEARRVADVARPSGKVVFEAFHYRYHPFARRIIETIQSGQLGEIRHIETWMHIPLWLPKDIRWQLPLAGGSLMDVGCYTIHQLRSFAGAEPEVVGAECKTIKDGIDRWSRADLRFEDGRTGRITAAMLGPKPLSMGGRVEGSKGHLTVRNMTAPQLLGRCKVTVNGSSRVDRAERTPTYQFQLEAFAGAVRRGEPFPTDLDDAIANMAVIDAVYEAAGLQPRQPSG